MHSRALWGRSRAFWGVSAFLSFPPLLMGRIRWGGSGLDLLPVMISGAGLILCGSPVLRWGLVSVLYNVGVGLAACIRSGGFGVSGAGGYPRKVSGSYILGGGLCGYPRRGCRWWSLCRSSPGLSVGRVDALLLVSLSPSYIVGSAALSLSLFGSLVFSFLRGV